MAEELAKHGDHVLVGVIVIVPEDDVVTRLPLWPVLGPGRGGLRQ
jgi:hypothetical protein